MLYGMRSYVDVGELVRASESLSELSVLMPELMFDVVRCQRAYLNCRF